MIQVIPINDIKQHTEDTTCDCEPSVQFENGELIVVHYAFDGRQHIEEGGCNLREGDDLSSIQPVKNNQ